MATDRRNLHSASSPIGSALWIRNDSFKSIDRETYRMIHTIRNGQRIKIGHICWSIFVNNGNTNLRRHWALGGFDFIYRTVQHLCFRFHELHTVDTKVSWAHACLPAHISSNPSTRATIALWKHPASKKILVAAIPYFQVEKINEANKFLHLRFPIVCVDVDRNCSILGLGYHSDRCLAIARSAVLSDGAPLV